jgi:uncharacterized ubiquitin-like protein YukD
LGDLNLSRGGKYPLRYALRLGAGFGSQIAMALFRVIPGVKERVNQPVYQKWLAEIAGYQQVELEVEKHTLRIQHAGPPVNTPAKSSWQYGQGPTLWADKPEDKVHTPVTQPQKVTDPTPSPVPVAVVETAPTTEIPESQPVAVHENISADRKAIEAFVLSVVSEKTGYPSEMLDLDLDLEADLGIDTVKQAELFATIRTNYSIPRREDLRLVDYNTLSKVVDFMVEELDGQIQPATAPVIEQPVTVTDQVTVAEETRVSTAPATADRKAIEVFVLSVVSEKTGYPSEMLDLDLDLEADLGIDTVKQAELFATIRTNYSIPRREDLRLVDYNTLNKVVDFMIEAIGGQTVPTATPVIEQPVTVADQVTVPEETRVSTAPATADRKAIEAFVLSAVSEKTGYPVEMLDLDLDLEADLGIDTVKQAELFATIRTNYSIPRREDLRLVDYNTLNKVVDFMVEAIGGQTVPTATPEVEQPVVVTDQVTLPEETRVSTAPATADRKAIEAFVLSAVSEKTGYPSEMLDLDLDLEADLGIDTVKQAELFATIRTNYSIPRREDLRLVDYNTLNKVVDFMIEALETQGQPEPAATVVEIPAVIEPAQEKEATRAEVTELAPEAETVQIETQPVIEPTEEQKPAEMGTKIRRRVPVAVLRPRLDVCVETGVKLEEGTRVVVVSDGGKTADSLARRLRARKVQVLMVSAFPIEAMKEKFVPGNLKDRPQVCTTCRRSKQGSGWTRWIQPPGRPHWMNRSCRCIICCVKLPTSRSWYQRLDWVGRMGMDPRPLLNR